MYNYYIIKAGKVQEVANSKWVWFALGRTSKKKFDSFHDAFKAARNALGGSIQLYDEETFEYLA